MFPSVLVHCVSAVRSLTHIECHLIRTKGLVAFFVGFVRVRCDLVAFSVVSFVSISLFILVFFDTCILQHTQRNTQSQSVKYDAVLLDLPDFCRVATSFSGFFHFLNLKETKTVLKVLNFSSHFFLFPCME